MRRLELDFLKPANQPSRLAGWMLLVAGIALLVEMGVSYDRLQVEREKMNSEIRTSKLHLDMSRRESGSRQFTDKDFVEARQIMNRLSTPWDAFFTGLESIKNKNVVILSIEPDMQTGLMRIKGDARDYAAVLTLVAQLRTTKPFSNVFLQHHEIKRDDAQHPVNFTLSMHWVKPL